MRERRLLSFPVAPGTTQTWIWFLQLFLMRLVVTGRHHSREMRNLVDITHYTFKVSYPRNVRL